MQERVLWLLASAAGTILLVAALWPHAAHERRQDAGSHAPLPPPVPIRVAVLNGCGAPQAAARLTHRVRALGFDVIHEGNAENFNFLHTVVVDRRGDLDKARKVAAALGVESCIQQVLEDSFRLEEVSVIIGRDYERIDLLGHGGPPRKGNNAHSPR